MSSAKLKGRKLRCGDRVATQVGKLAEDRLVIDPSIARGLDYYTGTVYETILDDLPGIGSICSGGRYDDLVRRCGARPGDDFGAGFSLAIDPIRELLTETETKPPMTRQLMVAFSERSTLEAALERQRWWHQQGRSAVIELHPFHDRSKAEQQAQDQGGFQLDWIDP